MALWGAKDNIGANGTVSLNYATLVVTGAGTSFGQVGAAGTGDVIRFGLRAGTYFGDAVIVGIASTTTLSIASTTGLRGTAIASTSFTVSQLPKSSILDSHYTKLAGVNTGYDALVYGADVTETQASVETAYSLTHAGWVGITTYMCDGVMRVKTETLVAMSSIESDSSDDLVLPDAAVVILIQPQSIGVGTTGTARFNVVVEIIPSTIPPTYQWQYSSTGVAYTALTNNATYSGTTTAGLAVTNTSSILNNHRYRVVVSAAGATSVTSDPAIMTVS
ncbi:hypothetical protein b3_0317 [Synechococcus phage B3]|nr:hypothetical protein b3_0317 [Synechococcus phage B3]QGT54923.1 hypothetical protein b23_0310 [Synechococcus phage B23]